MRVVGERFVAGGEVLARGDGGQVVFVRGALPGEDVTVAITERRRDWARGTVTVVHTPSPERVTPPCPRRREGCGGCDWQHVAPGAQLDAKVAIVADALRRTARLPDAAVTPGGSVPHEGYRTTVRAAGDAEGHAAFRIERSHATVPAAGCLVAHPRLRELIDATTIPAGTEATLRVSSATGETSGGTSAAGGPIHEVVAGHRLRVSAGSFFQSGPAAAELLVAAVRRGAPELASARTVLDAYAGVGLFAVAAVPERAAVIAVESSRSSVADCRVNLRGRRARVERGDVGRWRARAGEPIDVVIADPARAGLGKTGVAALAAPGAPVLVLVSCDPAALARDAALLAERGYRHDGTEVLDLFPHTHHVEAVTRFVQVSGLRSRADRRGDQLSRCGPSAA